LPPRARLAMNMSNNRFSRACRRGATVSQKLTASPR